MVKNHGPITVRMPKLRTTAAVALAGIVAAGVFHSWRLGAQSSGAGPAFEVVSIKPNTSGDTRAQIQPAQPGGRWAATNVSLRLLVGRAYQINPDIQTAGAPSWFNADRFDIVASAESSFTGAELNLMLQRLLDERFKLVVHHESRALPVYALVPARGDGRLGSRLHPSSLDCAVLGAAALSRGNGPVPPPGCGGAQVFPGHFTASGISMLDVARNLQPFLNRIVVDRTGLAGTFDLTLEWTPDQLPPGPPPPGTPPLDPNGPSIFTAVQEQLGLKLESTKGPVDVLVIDGVEHPTPD